MKKIFIIVLFLLFSFSNRVFASESIFTGKWAEKLSERVVMDIFSNQDNSEYDIFITWREDNLAQKDIYRFKAKLDKDGSLTYSNGIHIYRFYENKNKFVDKLDYSDGSGKILVNNSNLVWIDNKDNNKTEFIKANNSLSNSTMIKNSLFSITLPEELKPVYEISKDRYSISVFHKKSKKAGFGGFAFGVKAYKNPSEHAVLPGSKKIGELVDKNGILYDIVLKFPTDVQYDYTKNVPEDFQLLYDFGNIVNIQGINNSTYYKNQGMLGKNLYNSVLNKHIKAIKEGWDSNRLEQENMSYMYNVLAQEGTSVLDKIGYTFYDVNVDGIDELLIGEIAEGKWKGVIYDIYTMVDRKPKHVISGGSRNRYYVCDDSFICNEYSSGALESGVRVYNLVENSTELFPQVTFKYDGYKNNKNPYFISYSDEKWDNVSEKVFNERKQVFDKYERLEYIPLSKISGNEELGDKFNLKKEYFDYSVLLKEFPKDYYYTTVKINKSKYRILIVTNKVTDDKNKGLFYYVDKNEFVYPLGLIESTSLFSKSKNYIYLNNGSIKLYISDKDLKMKKLFNSKIKEKYQNIEFCTIESSDKFLGEFGSPAGDDVKKITIDGLYFEYHKPQYKKSYIKKLMKECLDEGVKTQVQMYSYMVKKLHP